MVSYARDIQALPYIIERQGIVIEVSSSFCRFTCYTLNELIGRPIKNVFKETLHVNVDLDSVEEEIEIYMFNKQLEPSEVILKVQQGRTVNCKVYSIVQKSEADLLSQLPFAGQMYHDNYYGIAVYDSRTFTLLKTNSKYFELFKGSYRNYKDILGLTIKEIVPDFEGSEAEKELKSITRTGHTLYLRDSAGLTGSVEARYWEHIIIPVKINEKVKLILFMVIDVTESVVCEKPWGEEKRITDFQAEQLKAMLQAEIEKRGFLEESLKIKDEFFYLIIHEFKTPLAVIDSALQTMQFLCKNSIPEQLNRFLNTIRQNTYRQLRLVNNLLDIIRIDAGQIKLNREVHDIVRITESIVNSIKAFAEQKGIEVTFKTNIAKKEIFIDEQKVERILLNLLSNALKFTPGGKKIEVSLRNRRYKSRNMVSISVKDEGIGIPGEKQECVFERFGQADTSLSRKAEGTGIGLYLVKLFTEVMEGHIILESEEGKGSNFTVMFPSIKALSLKDTPAETQGQMTNDSRLIRSVCIEFSDVYL